MNIHLIRIIVLLFAFSVSSCSDDVKIMAAIQNGEEVEEGILSPFSMDQNYPNPFNGTTSIGIWIAQPIRLVMRVYSDDWQEVVTLFDNDFTKSGVYYIQFNAKDSKGKELPSGEYFYTLQGDGLMLIKKMKLMK